MESLAYSFSIANRNNPKHGGKKNRYAKYQNQKTFGIELLKDSRNNHRTAMAERVRFYHFTQPPVQNFQRSSGGLIHAFEVLQLRGLERINPICGFLEEVVVEGVEDQMWSLVIGQVDLEVGSVNGSLVFRWRDWWWAGAVVIVGKRVVGVEE
ncbi:unnamed protein product [Fraxinus pennsylvanica]|uniref:Uncharacterized protein n=1 Tax=Fraxinus pennsylvanica TaxID=56036 RepID=A0AAD1ZDL3_9LAMI|nr:unnamed protein product [Fraxinus pennsylvanica]